MSQSDDQRDKDKGHQWSPMYDKIRQPQPSPAPQTQQPNADTSVGKQQGSDAQKPESGDKKPRRKVKGEVAKDQQKRNQS